jgi:hypothetical protein
MMDFPTVIASSDSIYSDSIPGRFAGGWRHGAPPTTVNNFIFGGLDYRTLMISVEMSTGRAEKALAWASRLGTDHV